MMALVTASEVESFEERLGNAVRTGDAGVVRDPGAGGGGILGPGVAFGGGRQPHDPGAGPWRAAAPSRRT